MNPFSSQHTDTVSLPSDVENSVVLRKLNGRQLGRAAKAYFNEMMAEVVARGGAKVQKEIQELFKDDEKKADEKIEKVKADPLNGYDPYALLYSGIVSWTYPDSLERVPVTDFTVTVGRSVTTIVIAAIDDLDDEAVDFLARAVLKLTKPSLFETQDEQAAAQKNV